MSRSAYSPRIAEVLAAIGRAEVNPLYVEAYMRLEYTTLDGLSPTAFKREVAIGVQCVDTDGEENARGCAESFGLI